MNSKEQKAVLALWVFVQEVESASGRGAVANVTTQERERLLSLAKSAATLARCALAVLSDPASAELALQMDAEAHQAHQVRANSLGPLTFSPYLAIHSSNDTALEHLPCASAFRTSTQPRRLNSAQDVACRTIALLIEEVDSSANQGLRADATGVEQRALLKALQYSAGLARCAFDVLKNPDASWAVTTFNNMQEGAAQERSRLFSKDAGPTYLTIDPVTQQSLTA